MRVELLSPAGDLDAAYAAFHYGADAIYLGLKRFSARAEAANFSPCELGEIVAFAHAAKPRRSVFVALNTLVTDEELDEAVASLADVGGTGADAVIVQDLGVARLVRRHFPSLALHASTQMAIHNVSGALAARELGFRRITLAREMTLREVEAVVRQSGLEVEVFIHGALCYSYSGLCLYSSLLRGRSGNRGQCAYPCRDAFEGCGVGGRHPFSMKDLALADGVLKAKEAGVLSFKIEGRKKSALYVAAVTHYYRRLLDGRLSRDAKQVAEEDIKTIFSRPWTDLYARSAKNRTVTDADVVGHRGAPIGVAECIVRQGRDEWLRFKTRRRLERHDGIQTDVPGQARPFGFPVDRLRPGGVTGGRSSEVFEVPARSVAEVVLPREHPPIEPGAPLYCSSSQEVKQRYRFTRPKPGAFRLRIPVRVRVTVRHDTIKAAAVLPDEGGTVEASTSGAFERSRDPAGVEEAVRAAFGKLGDTDLALERLDVDNPDGLFMPASLLNRLRRDMTGRLAERIESQKRAELRRICASESSPADGVSAGEPAVRTASPPGWSLKVDRASYLDDFEDVDLENLRRVIIDIRGDPLPDLMAALPALAARIGNERIVPALPMMARVWEAQSLAEKVDALVRCGWTRWEVASMWGWAWMRERPGCAAVSADWPLYVMNRSAARQLRDMGFETVTLPPDIDRQTMALLLRDFGDLAAVAMYQDTPLFLSETCALAAKVGRCPAESGCRDSEREWESGNGEPVRLIQQGCRSVVVNRRPLCLAGHLDEIRAMGGSHLRADFVFRRYTPEEVRRVWRTLRAGGSVPGYEGNY